MDRHVDRLYYNWDLLMDAERQELDSHLNSIPQGHKFVLRHEIVDYCRFDTVFFTPNVEISERTSCF